MQENEKQENEKQEMFWDFEIQTDYPINARWPYTLLFNKKKRTYHLMELCNFS